MTVLGDAGIGKSRLLLLYELDNWIELHPVSAYFFKGRAVATRAAEALRCCAMRWPTASACRTAPPRRSSRRRCSRVSPRPPTPAVNKDTRDDIVRILGRAALESDVLDAMPTTGAGVDIAVIADALLDELAG